MPTTVEPREGFYRVVPSFCRTPGRTPSKCCLGCRGFICRSHKGEGFPLRLRGPLVSLPTRDRSGGRAPLRQVCQGVPLGVPDLVETTESGKINTEPSAGWKGEVVGGRVWRTPSVF